MNLKNDASSGRGWRLALLPAIAGIVITVGVALAMTTTDQASFCGSCHSMAEAALTHKTSVHAKLACNDCHAPHNLAAKIPFKTKEGARDILATATKSIPDLIHPGEETKDVTQANCQRCHDATTSTVIMQSKQFCTDCHRHVPHSPKIPVAKRSAADA
ncbi:MAG: NapC/NirT family cytochrome c [Desulfomicrobium sp.]|nr:NapC/NirT family cytochrome c [Desulfomicrobium sp.]MDP3429400.1 NapC/NirT family cytochrome c [Desulfomicrobium sp.]